MRPRPCGWSRDQRCGAVVIFDEMRRAVEAAAPDRLGDVAAAVWKAYGAGGLTEGPVRLRLSPSHGHGWEGEDQQQKASARSTH